VEEEDRSIFIMKEEKKKIVTYVLLLYILLQDQTPILGHNPSSFFQHDLRTYFGEITNLIVMFLTWLV
jgi:hypothetical protein